MACSGCNRRRQNIIDASKQGLRVTRQVADRIRRTLGTPQEIKYDNIKMTSEGVIKVCSKCGIQSEPAPTAAQISNLSCDECKG